MSKHHFFHHKEKLPKQIGELPLRIPVSGCMMSGIDINKIGDLILHSLVLTRRRFAVGHFSSIMFQFGFFRQAGLQFSHNTKTFEHFIIRQFLGPNQIAQLLNMCDSSSSRSTTTICGEDSTGELERASLIFDHFIVTR